MSTYSINIRVTQELNKHLQQQIADREIPWKPLPSQFTVPVDLDVEVYCEAWV